MSPPRGTSSAGMSEMVSRRLRQAPGACPQPSTPRVPLSRSTSSRLLAGFHQFWAKPEIKRQLRNLAQRFLYTKKTIIVTTPTPQVPLELRDDAVVVDFAGPGAAEIEGVLASIAATPGARVDLTKLGREKLVQAALGPPSLRRGGYSGRRL